MVCMRNRIVALALFVAVAPACVEGEGDDFAELRANSVALDDFGDPPLDERILLGRPAHDPHGHENRSGDSDSGGFETESRPRGTADPSSAEGPRRSSNPPGLSCPRGEADRIRA